MQNEQKKSLYVSVFQSKRSGNKCFALVLDLGYSKKFLSFDTHLCAELLNVSVLALYDYQYGEHPVI